MLSKKGLISALLLSCGSFASYAQIDVSITTPENENSQSVQQFDISINSDVPLKYVTTIVDTAEFCEQFFFLSSSKIINSKEYSEQVIYNYKDHKWSIGQNVCLHIEDENGEQYSFSSQESITLAKPVFNLEQVATEQAVSEFEIKENQGLVSNQVNYIYEPVNVGTPISFNLSGQLESDVQLILISKNNGDIISQVTSVDGYWQLNDILIDVLEGSRFTDHRFNVKGIHPLAPDTVLFNQSITFSGRNINIDVYQTPQDPINEAVDSSAVSRWKIDTPLKIVEQRLLMLTQAEQCQHNNPNASVIIPVTDNKYDFINNSSTYDKYACLQVEDEDGNLFTQDIGWIRKQALPEIIISDDIAADKTYFDHFSGYVTGAEQVKLSYLSDEGYLTREETLARCKTFTSGISLKPDSFQFVLSEPSLHDRYACIAADNGNGGVSYWMSENKINLHDGIKIVQNKQPRYKSTAYPTHLLIPEKLQNSTFNNVGCRGVLLSADLALTAGHCDGHFFHSARGVWGQSPRTTSYILAIDEEENNTYETLKSDLIINYLANEGKEGSLTREQFTQELHRLYDEYAKYTVSEYRTYISPYFGSGNSAIKTFADFLLRDMATPYSGDANKLSYAQPLVYTYPSDIHLTAGEVRGHGSHQNSPMSGWMGGIIHTNLPAGSNTPQYTLVDTAGGESGSALWAYDSLLDTYGVIGAVRGGGSWSSVWSHGRVTRQALAHSRAKGLQRRLDNSDGNQYSYRDLRRALARADSEKLTKIIASGVNVNLNGNAEQDGWLLARSIDLAIMAEQKLAKRYNEKNQQAYQGRINVIKVLMLGGADPRLKVSKPTRHMAIESGDSVLHYAVRTNLFDVMEAIWLNTTDFDFESVSREVVNNAGDTPLHVAIDQQVDLSIFKLLFTDAGEDIFIANAQGESSLAKLLNQETINDQHVDYIDWIGKTFSYEPISITSEGTISHQDWVPLLCHRFDYQGASYSFNEFAELRSGSLTPQAVAAITRLGNRSGLNASFYCQ